MCFMHVLFMISVLSTCFIGVPSCHLHPVKGLLSVSFDWVALLCNKCKHGVKNHKTKQTMDVCQYQQTACCNFVSNKCKRSEKLQSKTNDECVLT